MDLGGPNVLGTSRLMTIQGCIGPVQGLLTSSCRAAEMTIQSDSLSSPTPPFVWEDAWKGAERVDIDTMTWERIHARMDSQLVGLTSGQVVQLGLGREGEGWEESTGIQQRGLTCQLVFRSTSLLPTCGEIGLLRDGRSKPKVEHAWAACGGRHLLALPKGRVRLSCSMELEALFRSTDAHSG